MSAIAPLRGSAGSRAVLLAYFVVAAVFVRAPFGVAAELIWPIEGPAESMLAFGAGYAAGGSTAIHRGLDLAAPSGAAVLAPAAGTVTFVGSVPGVGGGTVTAATIDVGSGISVTLLPLSAVTARRGQAVGTGERIAEVAESGDASSASPHLHVGVRKQDVYLDPATVLAPPATAPSSPSGAGEAAPAATSAGQQTADSVPAPAGAHAVAATPRPSGSSVGAQAQGAVPLATTVSAPAGAGAVGTGTSPVPAQPGAGPAVPQAPAASTGAPLAERWTAARPTRGRYGRESHAAPSVSRAAVVASRLVGSMNAVWRAALLGTLVGLAALWPIWRRRDREEQPEATTAPGGSDVAAAVGRW